MNAVAGVGWLIYGSVVRAGGNSEMREVGKFSSFLVLFFDL